MSEPDDPKIMQARAREQRSRTERTGPHANRLHEARATGRGLYVGYILVLLFASHAIVGVLFVQEILAWMKKPATVAATLPGVAALLAVLLALDIAGIVISKRKQSFLGISTGMWWSILFFGLIGGAGSVFYGMFTGR